MRRKTNKIAALSGLVVLTGGCESAKPVASSESSNSQETLKNTISMVDSASLVQRLKELAAVEFDTNSDELRVVSHAMCYIVASPQEQDYECSKCGAKTPSTAYSNGNIRSIRLVVNDIKALGYDVVLDESMFCSACSGMKHERPELIFKIRFSKNAEYHSAMSNVYDDYQTVYQFLLGKDNFLKYYSNGSLDKKFRIIEKMLGISVY
jgi:hypothetical protein